MIPEDSIRIALAKKTAKSIVDHGSIPMATLKESIILQEKVDELLAKEIEFPEQEPFPEIPEVDLTPVVEKLDELLAESKKKDLLEYELQIDEKTRKRLKGIDGKDGRDGVDGVNGKDGRDGIDGKDGSPDTPDQIVSKLESLEGEYRLDASSIKGLDSIVKETKVYGTRVLRNLADITNANEATAGQVLTKKSDGTFNFATPSGGAGSTTFIGLTDVPASYIGSNGKVVAVNATATALEFISVGGTGTVTSVVSTDGSATLGASPTTVPDIAVIKAPKLSTARNINGVAFDGTADITVADNTKVVANTAIVAGTGTKVTYDAKGLVTTSTSATTADIADSLNKRYVTDANLVVIGNTSGTNSGDNATNTQYSGLAASKQDTLTLTTTGTSGAATLIGATLNIPQYSGGTGGTITTQDEGSILSTTVTTLNFTGAGVTASGAGATTTINIPGGGAGSTVSGQATVDFGAITQEDSYAAVTVGTASVLTSSIISVTPSGVATADHDTDDYQWDNISGYVTNIINGVSFDIIGVAPNGTWGQYKFNYTIN